MQLDAVLSATGERFRLNVAAAGNLRLMQQARFAEERTRTLSVDRLHVPVTVSVDRLRDDTVLRAGLMVAALDEGVVGTYGAVTGGYIRRLGRLTIDLGLGVMVGRPSEHVFLGTYDHRLVIAYPRLDLWWSLGAG